MKSSRLWLAVSILVLFFFTKQAKAQADCSDVTCKPDPSASWYAGAVAARPKMLNARGYSSPIVPQAPLRAAAASAANNTTVVGSQSYNYTIPILRMQGRAGMGLVLNLYYNSRDWDVDTANGTVTFNGDRDNPSYGFRLDVGYIEGTITGYILTEGDGTKHDLEGPGAPLNHFMATDGSYIDYNQISKVLAYKNGTTVQYQPFPSNGNLLRPVWIKDSNGNYFSIAYVTGHDQLIYQISDSLGRVITFNYDGSNRLTSLSQLVHPSGSKTYATFTWDKLYGSGYAWYNFSGLSVTGVPDLNTQLNVLKTCTYANGTGYRFTYGDWAIVTKIEKLSSTGVTRSFVSYDYPLASQGALSDAPTYTKETLSPDGTTANASAWTYSATKNATGVVTGMTTTDPNGGSTTTNLDPNSGLVLSVQVKDSSGTILRTITYSWKTTPLLSYVLQSAVLGSVTTTLGDTQQQSSVQYGYDAYANRTDIQENDFDGTLKRHTVTTYLTTGAYATQHILNLPSQILVKDGAGNTVSRTDLAYDGADLTSVTGATGHDDQVYGIGFTTRGNLTAMTRYSDAAGGTGSVVRNFYYDTLGNLITAQLDCCNQKRFNFSDVTQYSAPDSIVRGVSGGTQFTTSYTYNADNNLLLSGTDENNQQTQYQYDSMNRLIMVTLPPQSGTPVELNTAYGDDTAAPTVTSSNGADNAVTVATVDGLGHVLQVDTKDGSSLVSSVKYGYDQLWQRTQVSNPFGSNDTVVNTTFSYDALGRVTKVTPPSGGFTNYDYSGNAVTVTDPAGKQRKSVNDALGRLLEVDEPVIGTPVNPASGSGTVNGTEQSVQVLVTPAAGGSGSVTMSGAVQWNTVSNASTGGTTNITISGAEQQHPAGVIAGTGSVTLNGSEQVIPAIAATAAVTMSGNLQSKQVQTQAATVASGSVTINGSEGSTTVDPCSDKPADPAGNPPSPCPETVWDTGALSITVNGVTKTVSFGQGSDTWSLASALASAFGNMGTYTVTASGNVVSVTANSAGTSGNSITLGGSNGGDFWATASGSTLTGGQNAVFTTVYDSGTTTVTVNGRGDSSSWSGSGTTVASIASSLASAVNNDSSATVSASASGATVSLTAKTPGASGNVTLGCSSSYNSSQFSSPSFAVSCTSALSGGKDAIYDSGTVSITVNGHTNSVTFSSSSTPASLASAMAANINADTGASVTASASGATVNLTATTKGSISNYPLNAAVTYDSAHFSSSSFAAAGSGANLTGGWPDPNAIDNGSMTVKVNSTSYTVTWGSTATAGSIASALASALGSDPAVTPTLSGSTIYLDPKQPGAAYSFSTAYSYDSANFIQSSFTTTNSISDYGITAVTIAGHSDSVAWAGHSTTATVAAALASQINGDSAAPVTASVSGNAIALTARTTGASTNYTLGSSNSYDSAHFSASSFAASNSGTALAGGADAVYKTVYDAGTVWIEVNGFQASTPYQQGSTAASIASALANQFNGSGSPVSASLSGSVLTLTANQKGSPSDYSLSAGSTTSQSGNFAQPSFAVSVSGPTLTGGTDTTPTFTPTSYTYDVQDNLLQVTQGSQTRSVGYDGLGRVLNSTTPESGTVTNYYTDSSGNACSGDPSLSCRVKDARGTIKTFSYDGINRVTGVTYSDGTPSVTYQYDTGGSGAFALDRLTKIIEGSNSQTFTYDNFGRILSVSQAIDQNTYSTQYGYNLAGQLTSITYPTGRVVKQNVDTIGRLSSISDTATYLSSVTYNGAGETLGFTLGNGVQSSFGYNDHLQLSSLRYFAAGNASDVLNLRYDYGTGNNGQIESIRYYSAPGVEDTTKSEYFSYDILGRLNAAHTGKVDSTSGTWSLQWGFDRFGNRLSQTLVGGNVSIGQPNLTVDPATNRITNSGYQYDASGNMTSDSVNAYSYDGANRLQQINGGSATYTYFGPLRIKKVLGSTTTVYIYSGSKPIVEYVSGAVSKEYIYSGSSLLATVAGNSTTYHHPDHLSNRAETDASGNVVRTDGHFPFGEAWYESGTSDKWKFTTYEHDSGMGETGLDYAQFRHLSAGLGRFINVDRLAGSLTAPQSMNRYAYAMNDPVNLLDPLGLSVVWICVDTPSGKVCWISEDSTVVDVNGGGWPRIGIGGLASGASDSPFEMEGPAHDIGPGVAEARTRLQNDKCKDLFKKSGTDPIGLLDLMNKNGLIQVDSTYPRGNKPGKRGTFESGNTGAVTSTAAGSYPSASDPSKRVSSDVITINSNGFYFSAQMTKPDHTRVNVNTLSEFSGLTLTEVQAAVIIHELTHVSGDAKPDGPDQIDSQTLSHENSQKVYDNCFKADPKKK